MEYIKLNVKYDKPDIWRRPSVEKLSKNGRSYMDFARELLEFDKLKEELKKEVSQVLDSNLKLCNSKSELNQRMSEIFEWYSKGIIPCDDLNPEFLLTKTNKNTLNKKLQGWCRNLAYNVPQIIKAKPFRNLCDKFKGIPAFVCLAGPSLKNNREKLKQLGKKGLIIAVDTSLRPLLDIGVIPDICVTHDANPNGCKFFLSKDHLTNVNNIQFNNMTDEQIGLAYATLLQDKERLKFKYDTIGIFVNYCHPLTLLAWNGLDKCFYAVHDPSLPVYDIMAGCTNLKEIGNRFEIEDKGRVTGGSSVGHVAVYIALQLGCNPISLLGLDLSYPGGKTYVEGASNQKDMSNQKLIDVEDLSGNRVPTNLSMFSYKMVFEKTLPFLILHTGVKFYNATEDERGHPAGILECGAYPQSLQHIIDKHCQKELDFDILKTLNNGV